MMSSMVNQLTGQRAEYVRKVSQLEFDTWKKEGVFDGLRNQRPGQSFCAKFNIQDNLLYFSQTPEEAYAIIRKRYLQSEPRNPS